MASIYQLVEDTWGLTAAFFDTFYGQIILNSGILVVAGLLMIVWFGLMKTLNFIARRTVTKLDNMLINALRAPVVWLIIFISIYLVINNIIFFIFGYSITSVGKVLPYVIFVVLIWSFLRFIKDMEKKTIIEEHSILPRVIRDRVKLDKHSLRLIIFVLRFSVICIVILTTLSMLGVSLAGLLAFGGLGGIVLGFALKDPLSNFFAGAIIFWERPFVVGDWIRCPTLNIEGVVVNINWRTTLINTFDRRPLYVPNAVFITNYVENAQRMTNRRIYETIGVRYEDMDKLPALLGDIRRMVKEHPGVDDSQTFVVAFDEYGDYSLNFFICAITYATTWEEFQKVKEEILLRVSDLIKKHKANFAYPTRTIKLENKNLLD